MIPGWQMAAFERLRVGIVKSVVDDLHKAMRKTERLGFVCDEQIELEKWFLSKWGQLLCENRGQYILERCKATYTPRSSKARKQVLSNDEERRLYMDFKSGMKLREIMRKYKLKDKTVYAIIRRWKN